MSDVEQTTPAEQEPQTGDATGTNGGEEKRFTQAEFEAHLKERLKREQEKAAAAAERARQEAAEQALAEQQKFQELAEKRGSRVAELEPQVEALTAEVEALRGAVQAQLDAAREGLPEHVTILLDKLPPAEQLAYIAANREKLVGGRGTVPPTPDASSGRQITNEQKERARQGFAHTVKGW